MTQAVGPGLHLEGWGKSLNEEVMETHDTRP